MQRVQGGGFGFVGDVVVGLVGAFIAGLILHAITGSDAAGSFIREIIVAFLGACLLLALLRAIGRGTRGGKGATAAFRGQPHPECRDARRWC